MRNGALTVSATPRAARWALTLGIGVMVGLFSDPLCADQPLPMMTVGYQSGKITAVYQTTFLIDGRTYRLAPDAVIYDDSGNRIDAGYIGVDLEVKFHVKKEQNDTVDTMVLSLPR